MYEPVKVTIGGAEVSVPTKLNFVALKRCKPALARISDGLDAIDMADIGIAVIAAAFGEGNPEMTVDAISERLLPSELSGVCAAITNIMVQSGYWKMPEPGEATPAAAPAPAGPTST
jgi:hypothetical protein